jgi:hypothetical protein
MDRFILTSTAFTGEVEFRFDGDEGLKFYENRSTMDLKQRGHLYGRFPFTWSLLKELCLASTTLTLTKITVQVTFKEFYDAYANKVGNKARAEKLFNALKDTERALIMEHLPLYDAYLAARPRMEKAYPETYLSQRRWENELPTK